MRRKWLAMLLGLAAVFVTVENLVFFRSVGADAVPLLDASAEEPELDPTTSEPGTELASMSYGQVLAQIEALPAQDFPRSPFLTQAEAQQLAWRSFGAGDAAGQDQEPPLLDGTLWSLGRRVAWLGGFPRSEGDEVGSFRIEQIEPGSVLLRFDDQKLRVALREGTGVRADESVPLIESDPEEQVHGR